MLNKKIVKKLLIELKESGRKLDYYMIKNLFEYKQLKIINELKKYQNEDGGFGNGLEPDVRLPYSNVVSTEQAIEILNEIEDSVIKDELIKQIVNYLEDSYIESVFGWELVPQSVNQYPRAIWWNYPGLENYSYGNPNPQIIGFLYEHSHYLNKLDINFLVNKVIYYIESEFLSESNKHNTLCCLNFYTQMPKDIQNRIRQNLQLAVDKELLNTNWDEYTLEPYEILLISPCFLDEHLVLLNKNIEHCVARLQQGLIQPTWNWNQFDEAFESAKKEWAGRLTFNVIKAILLN